MKKQIILLASLLEIFSLNSCNQTSNSFILTAKFVSKSNQIVVNSSEFTVDFEFESGHTLTLIDLQDMSKNLYENTPRSYYSDSDLSFNYYIKIYGPCYDEKLNNRIKIGDKITENKTVYYSLSLNEINIK